MTEWIATLELPQPMQPARVESRSLRPVSRRQRVLLYVLFGVAGLLAVTGLLQLGVTIAEYSLGGTPQSYAYFFSYLIHVGLGLIATPLLAVYGVRHWRQARLRRNLKAQRRGFVLLGCAAALTGAGLLLVQVDVAGLAVRVPSGLMRALLYAAHVLAGPVMFGAFIWHRGAGRPLQRHFAWILLCGLAAMLAAAIFLHAQDPRRWRTVMPASGADYFAPSLARTETGGFIPARALANDETCRSCHADIHQEWSESAHHHSSYSNANYLAALRNTMRFLEERDGDARGARLCAACHDPVMLFSGALARSDLQDPDYNFASHRFASAGVTCSVCHSVTHVDAGQGNGAYTLDEPPAYPFAYSTSSFLQWLHRQLIFAKPALHKQSYLKPLHQSVEFCGACHKFSLPHQYTGNGSVALIDQYGSFCGSSVSGHNVADFYIPARARANCNSCHMPAIDAASGRGAPGATGVSHRFAPPVPQSLTALPSAPSQRQRLQGPTAPPARVDIFGLHLDEGLESRLEAPLRPSVPPLKPGRRYLLAVVLRNLGMGHDLGASAVSGEQMWLKLVVRLNDEVIAETGVPDARSGELAADVHRLEKWMVDADGTRVLSHDIARAVATLYDHSIPPHASSVVHYLLAAPHDKEGTLTLSAELCRTRPRAVAEQVAEPIEVIAADSLQFPLGADALPLHGLESPAPAWERWNDYGIGRLRDPKQAGLAAAERAFVQSSSAEGTINLVRTCLESGRVDQARRLVNELAGNPLVQRWRHAYWRARVEQADGRFAQAIAEYRGILEDNGREWRAAGLDFAQDVGLLQQAGSACLDQATAIMGHAQAVDAGGPSRSSPVQAERGTLSSRTSSTGGEANSALRQGREFLEHALRIQPNDVASLRLLAKVRRLMGDEPGAAELHKRVELLAGDERVRDRALNLARTKSPEAARAADGTHIYELRAP